MAPIIIRPVTIIEVEALRQISMQCFEETFSKDNTAEDMAKYLEESFSLAQLTKEMNDRNSSFYFAWQGESPVGYLKLNVGNAQTENKEENAMEVERIYLLQAHQGKGVGQLLLDKAIEEAKRQQKAYLWLGVWEHNTKAIRFYEKQGFVVFGHHEFRLGNEVQTDLMMRLEV